MIKAKLIKCALCLLSFRNTIPIPIAEGEIKRVTKDTFVAPARFKILKNSEYANAVVRTAKLIVARIAALFGSVNLEGISINKVRAVI